MLGRLYIDGNDAYSTYGIYVETGGWNELISMAPLKAVEYNDWQEEDGIEVDLSSPVLDSNEVTVKFACNDFYNKFIGFRQLMSNGAYHTFNCVSIGRLFYLRYVSEQYSEENGIIKVSVKFADDFPLDSPIRDYHYLYPIRHIPLDYNYLIDNLPFSTYDVRILKGSLAPIKKYADVKLNLLRNIPSVSGAIYDYENVTYKSKDVTLNCLMTAPTLNSLWRNYDALLYNMILPDARVLYVGALEQDFPCYYKSCKVTEFFPDTGKIWLRFTLTFEFIGDSRITDEDLLLASESDIIVFAENNLDAIDLQEYNNN